VRPRLGRSSGDLTALTQLAGGAETAGDTALEVVRQKRVEERVETAVDVGETGARNPHDDDPGGHGQGVLDEEGDVERQPADGEHGNDHDHHPRHSSLGQHRLTTSRRRGHYRRRRTSIRVMLAPRDASHMQRQTSQS